MFKISLLKPVSACALTAMLLPIAGCTSRGAAPAIPDAPTGLCALASCLQTTVPMGAAAKSPDGSAPVGLLEVGGTLYGTTTSGGAYDSASGGAGTVFSLSTAGVEQVLHSFGSGTDGGSPLSGLVSVKGALYGTTVYGGMHGRKRHVVGLGTAYRISTSGSEQVLHSFGKRGDGRAPYAGLIDVNGTLYGTTSLGGAHGLGTVFSISPSGEERVLYSFRRRPDGAHPYNNLVELNGTLYGTTLNGGKYNSSGVEDGGGILFSVSRSGKERILHYFGKPGDGAGPTGLVNVNGALYGTTLAGGGSGSYAPLGTVYRIDMLGNERVIHQFHGTSEGYPSSLIEVNGTLYGVANAVGLHPSGGNVFRMSLTGAIHVLHEFRVYSTDGAFPTSLISANGELYGTTSGGGTYSNGTVFSISLSTGTERVLYSFNPGR